MGGIAEKVRHEEGEDASFRIGPFQNLLERDRTLAETALHDFVEGEVLHRAQPQSQSDDHGHAQRGAHHFGFPLVTRQGQCLVGKPPCSKGTDDQQGEVGDFGVARERFEP